MKYKKYIVFGYYDYYPSGGLGDIKNSFNDLNEARDYCEIVPKDDVLYDNYNIVDRDTWEEIE